MILRATSTTVIGIRGETLGIRQPLLVKGSAPAGGWSSAIVFNGTKVVVSGASPVDVISSMAEILENNRVEFRTQDLWLTLNMDWLERTPEKNRRVSLESLLRIVESPAPKVSFRGSCPAEAWCPAYLDHMGFYLGVDEGKFSYSLLLNMADVFFAVASPVYSHKTGDDKLRLILSRHQTDLRMVPRHHAEEAREWFHYLHSDVSSALNLEQLSLEKLQQKYHW